MYRNTEFDIQEPDDSELLPIVEVEEEESERDFDIREPEQNPAPLEIVYAGKIEIWHR